MAKGEVSFTTEGKEAKKMTFKPLPTGDYNLKLDASRAEIRKKNEPGKFPYVSYSYEALDTAADGGKNRRVFHMLFTSLTPGKDGTPMPERANQLVGLAAAVGVPFTGGTVQQPDADGQMQSCISPKALLQWLQSLDGTVVKAHVKFKKGADGYGDGNEISYFEPSEDEGGIESEDFGSADADAAEEEGVEVEAEVAEETFEEEEAPAPPPARKPAPKQQPAKVHHLPAKKQVAGKRR